MSSVFSVVDRGMTLIELLVAFAIFIMLIGALVSLARTSLETWTAGENRKDIYDRAQIVLGALAEDLRNTYAENEVFSDGQKDLQVPLFACDLDGSGRQRLRFVRAPGVAGSGGRGNARRIVPPMIYADLMEVAYVMDHDPAKSTLWRGVRSFDRNLQDTLLRPAGYDDPKDRLFQDCFRPVETGVLYVGYQFWTQYTTTWDENARIQKVGPASKQSSGAETRWDSSRRIDNKFYFYKRAFDRTNPDFVHPEIVQINVVLESTAPAVHGIKLAEACDARASTLRLNDTSGLPEAPGPVKIDAEWVEYGGKTFNELTQVRRGRRLSAAASHAAQAGVHFGESFTTDVRVPAWREAEEP